MGDQKYVPVIINAKIPVTDEELYELCVRSNGEDELDLEQTGYGYFEVQLSEEEVKDFLKRDFILGIEYHLKSGPIMGYGFIDGDDLDRLYDKWFYEEKKRKIAAKKEET